MIGQVKTKLTKIFLTSLVLLISTILVITYFFIEYNIRKTSLDHLQLNFEVEFLPHYTKRDFSTLGKIIEDELFQVFQEDGGKVLSVQTHVEYDPAINMAILKEVISGKESRYEFKRHKKDRYLLYYVPLDDGNVCRIVSPMAARYEIKQGFLDTMLISLPLLLGISFFLTRFLVRESLKPIQRVFTFQETFSSNLTHELNSPLTSIKGTLEVILRKERTLPEYRDGIKNTLKNINRIIALLNNLYLLAIADHEKLQLAVKRLDMAQLISEAVDKFEPQIFAKKIQLDMDLEADSKCIGDQALLSRAIENLIENAAKYTPENGRISLSTRNTVPNFIIRVTNTCTGISETDLRDLYRPFYRQNSAADKYVKGAGLGLFIVKFIVESHQGTITSHLEGDSITFTILLPCKG